MTLDDYLTETGIAAADFAVKAGLTPASVSRIRAGGQNLRRNVMLRIIAASGDRITPEGLVHPHGNSPTLDHSDADTSQVNNSQTGKEGGNSALTIAA